MRRDLSKRCFLSLALLLLVSCSLLAFPGRAKRAEAPTRTQTPVVAAAQTGGAGQPTGSTGPETSSTDDVEAAPAIADAAALVDEAVCLSDDERDELMAIVEEGYADQMAAEDESPLPKGTVQSYRRSHPTISCPASCQKQALPAG